MAEIQSFLSDKAEKQIVAYEKTIKDLVNQYSKLANVARTLQNEQKKEEKNTKNLTTRQKEAQKLRTQLRSTIAKQEQAESKLNKELIKSKLALQEQTRALKEQAKSELGIKKRTTLFQGMTRSIIAAGGAFLGMNLAMKVGKELLRTFFAGTQNSADRLRVKLAGLKAQFDTLKDSIAKLGDTGGDALDKTETKLGLVLKTALFFAKTKFLGLDKAIELETIGIAAEELEKRLIALERAEANLSLVNAKRSREIAKLRLLAENDNETYDNRIKAIKAGAELLKQIDKDRSDQQRERIAISLTESEITEKQIEQIVEQGLKLEDVGLTLTTEKERVEVIKDITKYYEDQTQSLLKQKKLLANIQTLIDERDAKERKSESERKSRELSLVKEREDISKELRETLVSIEEEIESELDDIHQRELASWTKNEEEKTQKTKEEEEKRKEIRQEAINSLIDIGNLAFDFQQSNLDRELDALQTNYDARINAAQGNNEIQEALARELAQKQYEIQLEQAKAAKNQALFNIAISTAQGVAKALETSGAAGIVLGALVTASGLAQAAIVSNQPLPSPPQFATGTDYSPSTFIAGDGGRELMFGKDGKSYLTPNSSTLYTGMEGTKIIPNSQTEAILAATNMHAAGAINDNQLGMKLDAVVDAIERNKVNVNFDKRGVWNYSQGRSRFTQRKNRILHN